MKGILIWAVICLAICGIGAYFVQKDIMTTGTDIELSVSDSRTLEIKASEKVTFEGASSSFFMLYQKTGNSITANATKPPLGWISDTYYTTGPQEMATGVWLVGNGSPTIHLTSTQPITVTEAVPSKPLVWFAAVCVAILLWLFGLLIAAM